MQKSITCGRKFGLADTCFYYVLPCFLMAILFSPRLKAQTSPIQGIINHYATVAAIDSCLGALSVSDTAGFRPGTVLLVVQMQGAGVSSANTAQFGQITALLQAGFFEKNTIDSVAGGLLFLRYRLQHPYDPAGMVQVVTLPQFQDVLVADTLRARAWDGATGGILAFECSGTLTLQAPLMASSCGFRGGQAFSSDINNCNFLIPITGYFYEAGNWRSAFKGEGIARSIVGREMGRGALANGGGGGNDHNAGGGGGGHTGGGGKGGNNDEPSALGCDGYYPGLGGWPLPATPQRIFMGGGGGAGHSNNDKNNRGGQGGGIILVRAHQLQGQQQWLNVAGENAPEIDGDGGGGGGAGGAIWLEVDTFLSAVQLSAEGGKGASVRCLFQNRCFGPGGGGGGGHIVCPANLSGSTGGGAPGLLLESSAACNGQSSDAQPGNNGTLTPYAPVPAANQWNRPRIVQQSTNGSLCSGNAITLQVQTNAGSWNYQWQILSDNTWENLAEAAPFSGTQSQNLGYLPPAGSPDTLQVRCVVRRPGCSLEVAGAPIPIYIQEAPQALFTWNSTNNEVQFQNQSASADSYWWDFGDGQWSAEPSPAHTYAQAGAYTVALYAWNGCDTAVWQQTIVVQSLPTAGFSVPSVVTNCGPVSIPVENTASGNTTGFQWYFPGGSPEQSNDNNPVVVYNNTGLYNITQIAGNSSGQDTLLQQIQVQIYDFPLAAFTYTPLGAGQVAFIYQGQGAVSWNWNFGDGSPVDTSQQPVHSFPDTGQYIVTLTVLNPCGASTLQQAIQVLSTATGTPGVAAGWALFPNPARQGCLIRNLEGKPFDGRWQLYDALGRMLEAGRVESLSEWYISNPGIAGYFLLIVQDKEKTHTFRIMFLHP
jgi:PKD repeat protein